MNNRTRFISLGVCGLSLLFSLNSTVSAQSISTSAQLKQACENAPANMVNITHPTKIEFGPPLPMPENIVTGCTLKIGLNASFEVKQVAVSFGGPLMIQSSEKTKVVFEDAPWRAAAYDRADAVQNPDGVAAQDSVVVKGMNSGLQDKITRLLQNC